MLALWEFFWLSPDWVPMQVIQPALPPVSYQTGPKLRWAKGGFGRFDKP
jgi:hypothetical protein